MRLHASERHDDGGIRDRGCCLTLVLLFTIVEFGRILFSLNVLDESARRAARVAAVCAVGNGAIAQAATFVTLPNLTTPNIRHRVPRRERRRARQTLLAPATAAIEYVRVRIVNYAFPVAIPLIAAAFTAPEISSTLPRESLGVPRFGVAPTC